MGTRNRQRRAEKQRRRQQASVPRGGAPRGASPPRGQRRSEAPPLREVIYAAVATLRHPGRAGYRELLTLLAEGPWPVTAEVEAVLREAVRAAGAGNWSPDEMGRQVERGLGARHARYLADVIAGERPRSQAVTVEWLARAIEVLALVLALPPLPPLGPARAAPRCRPGHDPRMLEKVRALLAKAESTTFAEEAEALSAKAQELMARHAIDEAMVDAAAGVRDAPGGRRLAVDDPYARAKSTLLSVVAGANRCRAVWSEDVGFSTVFGFETDLEFVEVLYTSLLVQATSAMVAAGSQVDRSGRSRTRSFRQSFLLAYAARIGQRLREAEAASRSDAAEAYGEALLPVLSGRLAAVDAARDAAFPRLVSRSVSISNAAGWAAGSAAADLASLSGRAEVRASG